MDVSAYLDPRPAPRAVFDALAELGDRPRFYAPEPVTWSEFAERIRRIGALLCEVGLQPGDRAAIFAHNSIDWGAAALAIQTAGGAMVPIYPASTAEQAAYILDHSDAKVVFYADRIELRASGRTLSWDEAVALGAGDDAALMTRLDAVTLDDMAVMLYTSGTTGNPKGVPLTHGNVAYNARDWMEAVAPVLHEGAVDLLWLPMSHIFGFGELCLGNLLRFTSHMTTPQQALARLPDVRPTVFMSVPAYWEKLAVAAGAAADPVARLREITGGRLKFCLSGGAGLKREVKELFHSAGILIIEGYGLTETSPTLTINRPDDFRFDTVGKPLPTVDIRLADDGEILARGPNVFSGYHKDPDATRAAFTDDGWFKTGDIGVLTDDGFLQIVDRKKDILVTAGGKNVPPANIELRFRDDPFIEHVVVYGDGKKYLVAGVWPNHAAVVDALGAAPSTDSVHGLLRGRIDAVNAQLARFETIKRFAVFDSPLTVEGGLLTASLKVRRKNIYERYRDEFEALYAQGAA
jgi:long-chain acyl-CoA synthetase